MLLTSAADTKSSPSRAAGQDDEISGAATDSAPPISGSPAAESSAAGMESDEPTSSDGQLDEVARAATAEVQLSVPAEENFAFKSYINAHEEDERDHDASADRRGVEWCEPSRKRSCKRAAVQLQADKKRDNSALDDDGDDDDDDAGQARKAGERSSEQLRLLVRRREAGALIGKRGANIKRLRETFRNSLFSIPDTGNGPERVVCVASEAESIGPILADIAGLLVEKSPENDEQVELKLLIHSSHAGSIIGMGGQSIKKLRNESKAAIKIYEMCCPLSNERVCAIKARPPVVVSTIKLIQTILRDNQIKGTVKPYDALHFDLSLVDKYGGYLPEEPVDMFAAAGGHSAAAAAMAAAAMAAFAHDPPGACRGNQSERYQAHGAWQAATGLPGDGHFHCSPCEMHAQPGGHAHKLYREAPAAAFQRLLANTIQSNSARGQQQQVAHETTRGGKFQHHYHHNNQQQQQQQQHRQHPAAGRSGRFHPYVGAAALGSCQPPTPAPSAGYRSSNPRHSSALHFPSAFAAAAAAAGQQTSPRASYSAGGLNQFNLYPAAGSNNGNGSTRRHPQQSPSNTSPCLYLPLMQEHHQLAAACAQLSEKLNPSHNQHHHHQQQQYQKAEAQKAVQEGPIDGGGGNANGNTSK